MAKRDDWDDATIPGPIDPVQIGAPAWLQQRAAAALPPPQFQRPSSLLTFGQSASSGALGASVEAGTFGKHTDAGGRPIHDAEAGRAGLVSASNAASDDKRGARSSSRTRAVPEVPPDREPFQMLWCDPDKARPAVARLRTARKSNDDGWVGPKKAEKTEAGDASARERRDVARLLGCGPFAEIAGLGALLAESVEDTGEIAPTFAAIRGEIVIALDDSERLRTLTAALDALATIDKRLSDAVAHAKDVSGRKLTTRESIDGATRRLLDAHLVLSRSNSELEQTVDQALLKARAFQRRDVLGAAHVRIALVQGGRSVPAYVCADASALLPLCQRFRGVALVEVLSSQDDTEVSSFCVRPVAIGRSVTAF